MSRRHTLYLGGIALASLGGSVWETGTFRHGIPTPKWGGAVMFFVGITVLIYALLFRKKELDQNGLAAGTLICPKCETTHIKKKSPKDGLCPNCNVPLEPLVGFYERHPELKDKEDL